MTLPTARFYTVRSGLHKNVANMSMTVANRPIQLYTDQSGVLREIRDGEGHPFISPDVALALDGMPATSGWVILPVGDDEPEPDEEIVPLEPLSDGSYRQASGTVTARLMDTLTQLRSYKEIVAGLSRDLTTAREQLAAEKARAGEAEHAAMLMHDELATLRAETGKTSGRELLEPPVPAPMIGKTGKLTKARKYDTGQQRPVLADDSSVSTLMAQAPARPKVDTSDLDDIPRV